MEEGRYVTRDLCATDEERMTPKAVEAYINEQFKVGPNIELVSTPILFEQYPTLHAVDRVNKGRERCFIKSTYLL